MAQIQRRKTVTASISGVRVGSTAPVMVQSMTNTDTADISGTIKQVAALARAGSEVVRVTVNNDDAAKAIPHIVEGLENAPEALNLLFTGGNTGKVIVQV